MKNVNWIDLVVLILIIRNIYIGVKGGLTAELFKFIGTILSLTIAVYWYSQVAEILILNLSLPAWLSRFLCFVVIVQLIRVVFKYGVILVLKILHLQFVPQMEKVGGGAVGFGRGILASGVVLLALTLMPSEYIKASIYEKSFSGSFLVKASERTYRSLTFWMPESEARKDIFSFSATSGKIKKI